MDKTVVAQRSATGHIDPSAVTTTHIHIISTTTTGFLVLLIRRRHGLEDSACQQQRMPAVSPLFRSKCDSVW